MMTVESIYTGSVRLKTTINWRICRNHAHIDYIISDRSTLEWCYQKCTQTVQY